MSYNSDLVVLESENVYFYFLFISYKIMLLTMVMVGT